MVSIDGRLNPSMEGLSGKDALPRTKSSYE